MVTIDLRISLLRAALVTAANKDIRYYLNGVLVDVLPRAVRIVSTDGHRITVFHSELATDSDLAPAQIIIPRDVLKGIKGATGRIVMCSLTYDESNPLGECRIGGLDGGDRVFRPIDGRYPDYVRILPNSAPTGERGYFNPHYVADFAEVIRIALDKRARSNAYPDVHHNGKAAAAVTSADLPEFYGVIMPMSWTAAEWEIPAWLRAPAEVMELRKAA